ncbi:hypothetical protein B0A50_07225 [Salinomyces thailandicus]|uniref:Extracellular serine-rich protein n=1 Tax=Salinomyces thailandicus TaxID=706561 RepID=A0A4U0TMA6_9PEZI|nr:hypothetical protein B0A50_07225 [Salinomyces thailandica]
MHHALRLLSLLAALPSALCQLIQVIKVREDDLTFEPSSLTAPVGSRVQFHFDHHNISIASSAFDDPCRPDGRVFSGYVPVVGRSGVEGVFTVAIDDSEPLWYYGKLETDAACQKGLIGVINPLTSGPEELAAYARAAAGVAVDGGGGGGLLNVVGGTWEAVSAETSSTAVSGSSFGADGAMAATEAEEVSADRGLRRRRMRNGRRTAEPEREKLLWEASLLTE